MIATDYCQQELVEFRKGSAVIRDAQKLLTAIAILPSVQSKVTGYSLIVIGLVFLRHFDLDTYVKVGSEQFNKRDVVEGLCLKNGGPKVVGLNSNYAKQAWDMAFGASENDQGDGDDDGGVSPWGKTAYTLFQDTEIRNYQAFVPRLKADYLDVFSLDVLDRTDEQT